MRQDQRDPFANALDPARRAAYPPGEFVGQESFMRAAEILDLARRAGVGPGSRVLDLCCGVAGPGRLITREFGCDYLGVDQSASAIALARARPGGSACRFEVAEVPPVPQVPGGPFHVVLLLETLLAFPDKSPLLDEVARALPDGGRFAFTVEEGLPLTDDERGRMPDADTVWLIPWAELELELRRVGLSVVHQQECSDAHRRMADALIAAFLADAAAIRAAVGSRALEELLAAHRLWSDWLGSGRVRKFAVIARKPVNGPAAGLP